MFMDNRNILYCCGFVRRTDERTIPIYSRDDISHPHIDKYFAEAKQLEDYLKSKRKKYCC
jgi:hypothetical protein